MDIKSRKSYVLFASIGLIVGLVIGIFFVIYLNSSLFKELVELSEQQMKEMSSEYIATDNAFIDMNIFQQGGIILGFGYLFFVLISSILIAVNFFKTTTTAIKILAIVFFPVTYFGVFLVGNILSIPYYIYQIVLVKRNKSYIRKYF